MAARAALTLVLLSCSFAPDIPSGSVRCGDDGVCPRGMACGADNLCHASAEQTQSMIPDAAPDSAKPICGLAACAALGAQCGTVRDGCDHDVACPPCPEGYKCALHVCIPG